MTAFTVMVTKDGCKRNGPFDDRCDDLEESRLGVWNIVVHLIAGKNHQVRLLNIQYFCNEVDCQGIGITFLKLLSFCIDSITASSNARNHVSIRELDKLEFAVTPDS